MFTEYTSFSYVKRVKFSRFMPDYEYCIGEEEGYLKPQLTPKEREIAEIAEDTFGNALQKTSLALEMVIRIHDIPPSLAEFAQDAIRSAIVSQRQFNKRLEEI